MDWQPSAQDERQGVENQLVVSRRILREAPAGCNYELFEHKNGFTAETLRTQSKSIFSANKIPRQSGMQGLHVLVFLTYCFLCELSVSVVNN
jgi:hypothetical protein